MSIRWELLDDHQFVLLVSELLKRLGFMEVHVQGDGPDGGLDLVATELVSMTFQGARPLRWGIQCKFSKPGGRRAVNDSEVRDIEGILRAKRYESLGLQGYLLVTNRRVSHNVAERLWGIDSSSRFRASWLDGDRLSRHLGEQPEILDSYFGERLRQLDELVASQRKELNEELSGAGEFRVEPGEDPSTPETLVGLGNMSGTFRGATGLLELDHEESTGSVVGHYTYNSDDFVGDLEGEIHRGIMDYRFRWRKRDINGVGFYFVSPDGDHLEGMWLLSDDLDGASFDYLRHYGNRNSYSRA